MKCLVRLAVLAGISVGIFQPSQGFTMPTSKWFQSSECKSLEIRKHHSASKHRLVGAVLITNADSIKKIMSRIESLPDDGSEMISFGPNASHTDLVFVCGSGEQVIDIYQGGFKTPSTGFNAETPEQTSLVRDIETLVAAKLKAAVWKLPSVEVSFGDFSVTYNGSKDVDPQGTTASLKNSTFTIKDKTKQEQIITIISGQMPPQPFKFKVNGKKMTLYTFQTGKGERIYPKHYQIESRWL